MKIVYIAHPIGGDVKGNLLKIGEIFRALSLENKVIPFAPYIASVSCLHDDDPIEREIGMAQNRALFERKCFDELWVYGDSPGVRKEIEWAKRFGIKVVIK